MLQTSTDNGRYGELRGRSVLTRWLPSASHGAGIIGAVAIIRRALRLGSSLACIGLDVAGGGGDG